MLAYILAVLVGTSSVGLYLWAFLFPEIHRKQDFIWSGVGLFYALFLWLYARQVTGGILVGQTTSVALLGWFGWETFKLRRQLVSIDRSSHPEPSATNRQQPSDSRRAAPEAIKPAKTMPSPAATPSQPQSPPTATPERPRSVQTPVVSSIPLERVKVPPATPDRSTPTTTKVTPPEPPPIVNSSPINVTPSPPPIDLSPVTADEAWIKLEIKPAPAKPLGTPAQPPIASNPASSPVKLIAGAEVTPDLPERAGEPTTIASDAKDQE